MNDARTLMNRVSTGKYKDLSPETMADAKMGLELLNSANRNEKIAFAKKVADTKGSKCFNWIRTFQESLTAQSTTSQAVVENFYTRTVM